MPSRLEGAGASRCCAILALYNAGLMALQRRCAFETGIVSNADDGELPASEYGSPQCAARPAIAARCALLCDSSTHTAAHWVDRNLLQHD